MSKEEADEVGDSMIKFDGIRKLNSYSPQR
jgi:hypothetical protein